MERRVTALHWYLAAVSVVGLPLFAVAAGTIDPIDVKHRLLVVIVAAALLIAGEMKPIPVSRGADAGDELSISSTMAMALLLLAAPGVACATQAVALIVDELRGRRAWSRLFFNISQYTISLLAARLMFVVLTHNAMFGQPGAFRPSQLPAALAASLVFFLLNNGLTGIAVAVAIREPVPRLVLEDLRSHLPTAGVLLALAPVAAQALAWSVAAIPLLLVPLIAVHRSARLASEREHEALHDALTGLPNRTLFLNRLRQACRELDRRPLAVMLLDLDHFKDVNDTLGHHVGDLLLVEVAARLRSQLREGDLVARLGGDEFAVLAFRTGTETDAMDVAARIRAAFDVTFPLSGADLSARCSIGVALAPRDGENEDLLLKRADVAMYDAKNNRGAIAMYDHARDEHSVERLGLVAELRAGMRNGDVFPVYQPLCAATTGEVVGVEALIRWRHPQHGVLAPASFLDLAEGAGLLDDLTDVLLAEALRQLLHWHTAGHLIQLAVNVSPRTLRDPEFPGRVATALDSSGIDPQWLTLEITEHVLVTDAAKSIQAMLELRALGCRIAIDDFGTGYSSLSYLKRLPVDELKIDRSFVAMLGKDPQDEIIVRAAIDLAHQFGLSVTAEGVEDDLSWQMLAVMGADVVQGYHLSRPLTNDAFVTWLDARDSEPAAPSRKLQVI
jgi:diguanylate cyclase (GGDEF)-like protein